MDKNTKNNKPPKVASSQLNSKIIFVKHYNILMIFLFKIELFSLSLSALPNVFLSLYYAHYFYFVLSPDIPQVTYNRKRVTISVLYCLDRA